MIEDFGYALGDAEDFIDRERMHMLELVEDVLIGTKSAAGAKREINEVFSNAAKQIAEARALMDANGRRMGFSHLYASRHEEPVPASLPLGFRVVAELPGETA